MEPLKNLISAELIDAYAEAIHSTHKQFPKEDFKQKVLDRNWESRELRDRINHVAHSIEQHLNLEFAEAMEVLESAAPQLSTGFEHIIFPTYVEFFGLNDFERSMQSLERLTQYSTGEFAIRPFLKAEPKKTMAVMKKWSSSENEHVRRLSSEACRPRLPWGGNLPGFIKDPAPIIDLLEGLKNDSSLYVRKSVANNLNDISKDHADSVLGLSKRWLNEGHEHGPWIVKKALRTLLKQPHPEALQMFGYSNAKSIAIQDLSIAQKQVRIGDQVDFSFSLKNSSKEFGKLRVEYLIDYAKKKGSSEKVFQLSEFETKPNETKQFAKYQSFRNMTTRKHYPGMHYLKIRVNGEIKASQSFEVIE